MAIENQNIQNSSQEGSKSLFVKMLEKMTLQQKIILSIVSLASVFMIVAVFFWATSTDYALLYGNLSQADAAQIVAKLAENGVKYKLGGSGNLIYVPKEKLNDLKLSLAQEGLPEDPAVGYEIFDNNKFGMTDFMQRLNNRRALEGELSKTIASLRSVSTARVHIVVPKRALFAEEKKEPSASIVLKLKGSAGLNQKQIGGIINLVCNSVEGLHKANISILDNYGNQLNEQDDLTSVSGLSSSQFSLQQKVEKNLEVQAQSLLNRVLGSGKSVVKVHADLNFEKIERVLEEYDPEKQVLRSEERDEYTNSNNGSGESSTSNFEINKTVSTIVEEVGNIKRLSIAVSIDGLYEQVKDEDGKERIVYKPRSNQDLDQIKAMVSSALGFNSERGDIIEVANLKFAHDDLLLAEGKGLNPETVDLIKVSFKYLLIVVLVILALLVLKAIIKKSKDFSDSVLNKLVLANDTASDKIITPEGKVISAHELLQNESEAGESSLENKNLKEELSDVSRKRVEMQNKIKEFVTNNSEDASSLLKSWIYEDGSLGR